MHRPFVVSYLGWYLNSEQLALHVLQTQAVEVRKVEFANIRGTSATAQAISIACSDTVPCRELELENVNLTVEGGGQATALCYRASGKSVGTVVPPSCLAKS